MTCPRTALLLTLIAGFVAAPIARAEPEPAPVLPALYLDFSLGQQVVNLTPSKSPSLVYGDYRSGFRSVDTFSIAGGAGPAASFAQENSAGLTNSAWLQVGLVPIAGKDLTAVRFAKDKAALKRLPKLSVPWAATDLRTWSQGDAVTYASRGGIVFFAEAGIGYASLGVSAFAQGEFQTYVEKMDSNHAYVKISDSDLKSLSVKASATVTSVSVTKFHRLANGLSFLIDLSNADGANAYAALLRGNIAAAQKIAQSSGPVRHWEKASSDQSGNLGSIYFGVPVLMNIRYTSGQIQDYSTKKFFSGNNQVTANYGIFLNKQEENLVTIHRNTLEAFYGAAYRAQESGNRGVFGQYVWKYENNDTSAERIRLAMKDIVRKTGLRDLLPLKIPRKDDLGYAGVSLRVNFSHSQTQRMIRNAMRFANGKFSASAALIKNNYFATEISDIDQLCSGEYFTDTSEGREQDRCLQNLTDNTKTAADEMQATLREMNKYQAAGDDKSFANAYGRFGRAMATNQFTFQLAILLAGEGVQLDYLVEGSEFSSFALALESTKNPDKLFVRSSRGPAKAYTTGRGLPTIGHALEDTTELLDKRVGETPGLLAPRSLDLKP